MNINFAGEDGSDSEADITVNNATGSVVGRVSAKDGEVFLIQKRGQIHIWAEMDDKRLLNEDDDNKDLKKKVWITEK